MAEQIIGMRDLQRAIQRLGRVPQTAATQGAAAGGRIARKAAKANAPVDTGELKRGIIMKRERKTKPGKAVYDVTMDPTMNDVFAKESLSGERSYYPASQEYGWILTNGEYIPGYRFLRRSVDENDREIQKKIVEVATKKVDQAWARRQARER